ncbi:MAG: hypothetical protein QM724_05020 [Flavobacteriales bacterium]
MAPLLLALAPTVLLAQATGDSPYSSFGLGDLQPQALTPAALMGGTGVALNEPIGLVLGNPASYPNLFRPSFEGGLGIRTTRYSSSSGKDTRKDAGIAGFGVGVPFGKGKWGLALGLVPMSDVGYSITDVRSSEVGDIRYSYTGSGGVDRVFVGLGRVLHRGKALDKGGKASRLTVGANFDFLFGSVAQTRDAEYPLNTGFSDTRAFSSLVLRAPTFDAGLQFNSQLIPKERVALGLERRKQRYEAKVAAWKAAHPGEDVPFPALRVREAVPWRYTIGATIAPVTVMNATFTELVSSYITTSTGVETIRDTIRYNPGTRGTLELPMDLGLGVSVNNDRWTFTAEVHQRDWSALKLNVADHALPAPLRSTMTYAAGARFQPAYDGNVFARSIYRAGLRYGDDYREVFGRSLTATSVTLGLSMPINAAQTNSYIHFGVEAGQHGTTEGGLIQERWLMFRVGFSITPWKGERWFVPYRIQ